MRVPFRIGCMILCLLTIKSGLKAQSDSITHITKGIVSGSKKADSILLSVEKIPDKYYRKIDKKITVYSDRITGKTKKTLTKLARWESKIKNLLDKASPETSRKLFGDNAITFASLLHKIENGEDVVKKYQAQYDGYRDKLSTSIKYVASQKNKLDSSTIRTVNRLSGKVDSLEKDVANTEAIENYIKQRKKQLINEAIKYIGKSKYLTKINKESYYYVETIKNYKEIFSDPKKTEETVRTILDKIPAFQQFMRQNGALASLFGTGSNPSGAQSLEGLQTRAQVNAMLNEKLAQGGPNARAMLNEQLQQAHDQITQLKNKALKAGSNSSEVDMPDFKPNNQKSKTFLQRLEYTANFQFSKNSTRLPTTADIALGVGYKLNDKSIIGIGGVYKLGLGTIDHINITHQGVGLRTYLDWKIKKQFFATGGYEMNHFSQFKNIDQLKYANNWQQSCLVGISKKYKISKKLKGETKLLFDFLYQQHRPASQPIVFRAGYNF